MAYSAVRGSVALLDTKGLLASLMVPDRLPTEIQDLLHQPASLPARLLTTDKQLTAYSELMWTFTLR